MTISRPSNREAPELPARKQGRPSSAESSREPAQEASTMIGPDSNRILLVCPWCRRATPAPTAHKQPNGERLGTCDSCQGRIAWTPVMVRKIGL